ncbi:hypothetical protein V8G54_009797 [Vigna mungo]|uniref:Integrase catalytic domain-containing protein n=1 Tax=Vigna mungo TaxID=3915 RepID=A0AAQ3NV74_VIGMU
MNLAGLRNNVVKFNGLNYADWSEQIQFQLGVLDLDMSIMMDEMPAAITETSTNDEKSNRLSLNLMHMSMAENVKPSMPKTENAKEFMKMIKEYSQSDITDKSIVGTLMSELTTKKFDWSQPIHEHVTGMANIASRLKSMGMEVNEFFLVQFIMNSLPPEFGQFQVNYNTIKDKWNFQEIKAMLVQEEGRLKKMRDHSINLTTHEGLSFSKAKPGKKNKKDKAPMKVNKGNIQKDQKCFFCKKVSHFKKDCPKRKSWFERKGNECSAFLWHKILGHISKERMLRLVKNEILPQLDFDDWDRRSTVQRLRHCGRRTISAALTIASPLRSPLLATTIVVVLDAASSVAVAMESSVAIAVVVAAMVVVALTVALSVAVAMESSVVRHCSSSLGVVGMSMMMEKAESGQKLYTRMRLWEFPHQYVIEPTDGSSSDEISESSTVRVPKIFTIYGAAGMLRLLEGSYLLAITGVNVLDLTWDIQFSKFHLLRFFHVIVPNAISLLNNRYLLEFHFYLEVLEHHCCIAKNGLKDGKKSPKYVGHGESDQARDANESESPLGTRQSYDGKKPPLIERDTRGRKKPLQIVCGDSYCGVNALEVFINEVERQLERKVKVVRSDRGGEYYGKTDESGQCLGPFAKYLESRGICAQYTMSGTPQQNGVAERQNRTLMDMVRSMLSHSSIPLSLWMYSLKTNVYLVNRVPSKAISKTLYELWTGRKPSLRHLHVWMSSRSKKLDARTISGYFIGYPEKSKGYRFYCPNHSTRIVESGNARFIENGQFNGSEESRIVDIQEHTDSISTSNVSSEVVIPLVVSQSHNKQRQQINVPIPQNEHINVEPEPQEAALRRSVRLKKPAILNDYVVYSVEHESDLSIDEDPLSFRQAMKSNNSENWLNAMKEELKSMDDNKVWDLVELPKGSKRVGCKWVFKTKHDSKGNIERYKSRLVAKGFTQKDGIDYKETFSPVSKKDSLRIVLALVAHYDLELLQMDVKTVFLNGDLEEEVYMDQPEGFTMTGNENLVCKLEKSIYGLKQASRQWYLKFNDTITSYGFVENTVDQCIYIKVSGSKFVILVLYVDDILLATNDIGMLHDVKKFLSSNFEMKDMNEASYVIGIEIFRDRSQGLLSFPQKGYINKVLERFRMEKCSPGIVPIQKGTSFVKCNAMESIPYASVVGSLMYAQTCTRPDINFAVGMLGRYQSNPGMDHWKAAKKVLRYLQGTKEYMLTYRKSDHLEVIGYSDSDYAGCVDSRKSTFGYVYLLAGGAISWKSAKQSFIATSTMEAEFVACFEATVHALWLRNFVSRLGIIDSIARPIRIYCDNSASVFFSKNDKYSKGAKHMDLKYLSVKEEVQKHRVLIEHIRTYLMITDPLTKGLPPKTFVGHVESC